MTEKNSGKKRHTGRNATIAAVLLAALLGGGRYGLGWGQGGGQGLLIQSRGSTPQETVQESAAPATPAAEIEEDDGVLRIVVQESGILYEGRAVDLAELEEALLHDYNDDMTVTLTDDHAIKAAYDEVEALLTRLGIPVA